MTIDDILEQLSNHPEGVFPTAAIQAAVEQQEAITPHLLAYLQELIDFGEDIDDDFNNRPTLFAIFLLAQFREAKAYPLMVRLVSDWEGCADYHIGDAITGGLSRILASVCHGDTGPIKALVENEALDEFVRAAALESLITLFSEQVLSRDDLLTYFTWLFREYPARKNSFMWDSLVISTAAFRFTELLPDIRKAYQDGLANSDVAPLKYIEDEIVAEYDNLDGLFYHKHYITDTTAELSCWASFQPIKQQRTIPQSNTSYTPNARVLQDSGTFQRDTPKTGRNDPCPCGSGRKFKKCCG